MEKSKNIVVKCSCCCSCLEAESDPELFEDKSVCFSLWSRGVDSRLSLKERIRWAIGILKTGNPWSDHVIVSREDASKLAKFLSENT